MFLRNGATWNSFLRAGATWNSFLRAGTTWNYFAGRCHVAFAMCQARLSPPEAIRMEPLRRIVLWDLVNPM